tara:strand:+ start:184 stop:315 length:132 start_codon:yes stop_codon:yes gene_type:complete
MKTKTTLRLPWRRILGVLGEGISELPPGQPQSEISFFDYFNSE